MKYGHKSFQTAFRNKFYCRYRYNDVVSQYNLSLTQCSLMCSFQLLNCSPHTDLDNGSYRLSDLEIKITAGLTSRQSIPTPTYLIPPLVYPVVHVCRIPWFVFPTGLMRLITVRFHVISWHLTYFSFLFRSKHYAGCTLCEIKHRMLSLN
jgi:hypothetical protein